MIPKIIHQIWHPFTANATIPRDWQRFQLSWKRLHPTWEYKLWTEAESKSFVSTHYPDFFHVYEGYQEPIKRVDTLRILLLHHFGGVYVDLDVECVKAVDYMVEEIPGSQPSPCVVIPQEPDEHGKLWKRNGFDHPVVLSTAFLASSPGHPFWLRVIREFKDRALVLRPPEVRVDPMVDVMTTTGPFVLTDVWEQEEKPKEGPPEICVIPSTNFYPFSGAECAEGQVFELEKWMERVTSSPSTYGIHHWASSWNRPEERGKPATRRYPEGLPIKFREADGEVVIDGPLVSCIMVEPFGGIGSDIAFNSLVNQSYVHRELVRVPQGSRRLGEALREGIAKAKGAVIAIWKPGVYSSPDRLAGMMTVLLGMKTGAVFLERIGLIDKGKKLIAFSERKPWPETLIAHRAALPSRIRGDEWALDWLKNELATTGPVAVLDDPHLYWRTIGWEEEPSLSAHWPPEEYELALSLVGKHVPEILDG